MARTNTLQVFRSAHATYDADTDPSGLNYGELGWNNGGSKLFIGQQTTTGTPGTVVKFQINPAAALDVAGLVELATIAETNTGTDAARAVTPDGLDGWTGSAQVVTVGTIATGVWSGDALVAGKVPALNAITAPAGNVSMSDGSTNHKITGLGAPTSPNDAARKADVDAAVQGLDVHDSVRVLFVAASGSLSTLGDIDGVTPIAGDRILVTAQGTDNGIYVAATGAWTRAADANHADDLSANMFFFVEEGTVYKDTGWVCTTNETLTLANMVFAQFSGTGSYTAGDGLDLTGTEFGIADAGVTHARYQNIATTTIMGRKTASAGSPEALSASDAGIVLGLGGAALLDVGTDTDEVCAGDDDRLSDSRTPTTHSHGVGHGGTGLNTLLDGAVMLGNGVNAITMLAKVAAGQLLTSGGTAAGDEAAWSDSLTGITIDCGTF